jgi:hypothetical protein
MHTFPNRIRSDLERWRKLIPVWRAKAWLHLENGRLATSSWLRRHIFGAVAILSAAADAATLVVQNKVTSDFHRLRKLIPVWRAKAWLRLENGRLATNSWLHRHLFGVVAALIGVAAAASVYFAAFLEPYTAELFESTHTSRLSACS